MTVSFVSKILYVKQNTIHAYYNEIREKILQYFLREQSKELSEFELDESCFCVLLAHGEQQLYP